MKTPSPLQLVLIAAGTLGAGPLLAQSAQDLSGGYLGETYTGVDLGYTHHVQGPPDVLHRYGFISSRAMPEEFRDVDGAFKYNYTRGSAPGLDFSQHDVAMALTGYRRLDRVTPYLEGDAGWSWAKTDGTHRNSFLYLVGAGAEIAPVPRASITPFFNYGETARFHSRVWHYGAKAGYRFERSWSASFTLQFDDPHNVEFAAGVQRRF